MDQNERLEFQKNISVITHDLKSPLNSCRFFLGIVRNEMKRNPAMAEEVASKMENQLKKMTALINDVSIYSRLEKQHFLIESSNTKLIFDAVLEELDPLISKTKASITLGKDFPTLSVDKRHFQMLFKNIIKNAILYTDRTHANIKIDYKNDCFSVKDNGIGI
ncbi:HAMP domain-containing histidine kinase [bacterium]|nr:HAMP domain-containing histidine kinase [bacterium]